MECSLPSAMPIAHAEILSKQQAYLDCWRDPESAVHRPSACAALPFLSRLLLAVALARRQAASCRRLEADPMADSRSCSQPLACHGDDPQSARECSGLARAIRLASALA